jgi:CRISPR-associated protein Csm3
MSTITELTRVKVTGHIKLVSGLHIGAGKDTVEIGGVDNPVIKHPHSGEPYIPGSSIKGKLRSLLERGFGKLRQDGLPWGANDKNENAHFDPADPVLRIFGNALKEWCAGPTRLVLRDAPLATDWRDTVLADGLPLTEEKTEVLINRIAGRAHSNVGPRQTERVPAGATFEFAMTFRIFDINDDGGARDVACFNWLLQALDLLEQDALGGSGSRGYGCIEFENLALTPLGGAQIPLNNFRKHKFSRENPPKIWSPA